MARDGRKRTNGTPAQRERRELGRALRELRHQRELSLPTVAHHGYREDVQLDPGQIGQYERGKKRPCYRTLCAILDGLGLPPGTPLPWIVRLQLLRGLLEPAAVGLNEAEANLLLIEEALRASGEDYLEGLSAGLGTDIEEVERSSSESREAMSSAGSQEATRESRLKRPA